jgi:hypothetical protein
MSLPDQRPDFCQFADGPTLASNPADAIEFRDTGALLRPYNAPQQETDQGPQMPVKLTIEGTRATGDLALARVLAKLL